MNPGQSNSKPKFSAGVILEGLEIAKQWASEAAVFAGKLDWLGDANQHPEGSDERELALLRDRVDFQFNLCCREFAGIRCFRAAYTRCQDLLIDVIIQRKGDCADALRLMRRYHELFGDESESNGEVLASDTFPDMFAWDAYLRVSELPDLVAEFPKHLRHSARLMHGWPMIISRHLDVRPAFERLAELLEIGADYPLDAGPRKRRGTETPMLHYLEPRVWRLHVLRETIIETEATRGHEDFAARIRYLWSDFPDPPPAAEVLAILKVVPKLPPLTKKTARTWSAKVIVPLIMVEDAGTRETCKIPALVNIWRHRSVKSRATFKSRLHSAITDTLQRFGRPG